MRSSSGCAAAASGTECPSGTDPRAPSTTGSSVGLRQGSSSGSGRSWSPSVTNSAECSGSGSRPTRCWARPALGGKKTGKNPTDRGKKGTKKSMVTDGDGGPLGVVIAGANVLERRLLAATEEKKGCDRSQGHKPRRWVVERTFAWLSKCRGILVRYEKKDINYLALIQMACGLFWYRRLHRMGRCEANVVVT